MISSVLFDASYYFAGAYRSIILSCKHMISLLVCTTARNNRNNKQLASIIAPAYSSACTHT